MIDDKNKEPRARQNKERNFDAAPKIPVIPTGRLTTTSTILFPVMISSRLWHLSNSSMCVFNNYQYPLKFERKKRHGNIIVEILRNGTPSSGILFQVLHSFQSLKIHL